MLVQEQNRQNFTRVEPVTGDGSQAVVLDVAESKQSEGQSRGEGALVNRGLGRATVVFEHKP